MPVRMGLAKFEQIEGGFILCWVSQSLAKFSRGEETRNTERRQDHHEWARRFSAESENSERSWWERVDSIAFGRICYYQQQFGHVWQYDKLNVILLIFWGFWFISINTYTAQQDNRFPKLNNLNVLNNVFFIIQTVGKINHNWRYSKCYLKANKQVYSKKLTKHFVKRFVFHRRFIVDTIALQLQF